MRRVKSKFGHARNETAQRDGDILRKRVRQARGHERFREWFLGLAGRQWVHGNFEPLRNGRQNERPGAHDDQL